MPSGRTHDAITCLLAVPAFAAGYLFTHNAASAVVVGAAFIFGGLMFGPDLDTVSRQYSRWFILRFLWFPYRSFFKHRSRFSHGLIFGALIRVVYFMGVVTAAAFLAAYIYAASSGGKLPLLVDFARVWQPIGEFIRERFGEYFLPFVFLGLWFGAASHTFTDMAGSFIKAISTWRGASWSAHMICRCTHKDGCQLTRQVAGSPPAVPRDPRLTIWRTMRRPLSRIRLTTDRRLDP